MDVETAAPSAVETPSIEIPRSGTPEYADWRLNGTIAEKPKPAESTTADPSKETTSENTAPGTEPGKSTQESRRKPGAEARISELTARTKQLERELEEARRPKPTQAESSPAKPAPQVAQQEPTPEDKNADGTPKFKTYEEYTKALARWEIRQELAEQSRTQAAEAQQREAQAKVAEAQTRYPNFKEVVVPAVTAIVGDPQISPVIKTMLNDSEVFADLAFTLGSDAAEFAKFLQMAKTSPGKAIRYIAAVEAGIVDTLAKGAATRNEKGQFISEAEPKPPAKRGPESTPEPPIEINSRGGGSMDESARALKDGDFRSFKKAEDAKELRRRRGV